MSHIRGKQRSFRQKLIAYTFLLILFSISFWLYRQFGPRESFISPLGKDVSGSREKVEKVLREKNILFSNVIVLSDSSYQISIPNNGQIRLSSQKDIDKQVTSLQRILRDLTIEGKPFTSIDFRFEEPIISF